MFVPEGRCRCPASRSQCAGVSSGAQQETLCKHRDGGTNSDVVQANRFPSQGCSAAKKSRCADIVSSMILTVGGRPCPCGGAWPGLYGWYCCWPGCARSQRNWSLQVASRNSHIRLAVVVVLRSEVPQTEVLLDMARSPLLTLTPTEARFVSFHEHEAWLDARRIADRGVWKPTHPHFVICEKGCGNLEQTENV